MTVFVLVPGMFTGAQVWEETAGRLVAAGAEACAVTLSGLGEKGGGGAGIDLETHVADVTAAIDAVDPVRGGKVVLVAHDYGAHPALAAAGRRAERVARVVFVDAVMPQNGVPPLDSLLGEAAELARSAKGELPSPATPEEWRRWGSTEGIPAPALARLTELAAPQPLDTLRRPLRLTGAAELPTTGVLCTANGVGIAMVQNLVNMGDPALRALVDPQVTFFELPTGHWPMLSCPDELAEVLLRAAADEGHRLTLPDESELPGRLRPFPLDVTEVPCENRGNVDLYFPPARPGESEAQEPRPAVVFVHGGPVDAEIRPTPRNWPVIRGYAQYAAAQGVVGVTLDHRLHGLGDWERAAQDVAEAVELARSHPRVDGDRIALWFLSVGSLLSADRLAAPPRWLRCLAYCYPVLAPMAGWGLDEGRFHPAAAVAKAGALPIVLVRVGQENPEIAVTVEEFMSCAREHDGNLEVIDVPHGHHAFETVDPTEESREALRSAMRAVLRSLMA